MSQNLLSSTSRDSMQPNGANFVFQSTIQAELMRITLPELAAIPEASKRGSSLYVEESPDSAMRAARPPDNFTSEYDFFKGAVDVRLRDTGYGSLSRTFLNQGQNSLLQPRDLNSTSGPPRQSSVAVGPSMLSEVSTRMQNHISNKEKRQTIDQFLIRIHNQKKKEYDPRAESNKKIVKVLNQQIKRNQFEISTGIVGGKLQGNKDRLQGYLNAPTSKFSSVERLQVLKEANQQHWESYQKLRDMPAIAKRKQAKGAAALSKAKEPQPSPEPASPEKALNNIESQKSVMTQSPVKPPGTTDVPAEDPPAIGPVEEK